MHESNFSYRGPFNDLRKGTLEDRLSFSALVFLEVVQVWLADVHTVVGLLIASIFAPKLWLFQILMPDGGTKSC